MRKVAFVFACLAVLATSRSAVAQSFRPADEAQMARSVNAIRVAHGLPPLRVLVPLVTLARRHSTEMNQRQLLFHNHQIRVDLLALGVATSWTGENVVVAPTIDVAEEAFEASPPHMENILRPNYNAFGVGVVSDVDGSVWATQVFAEIKPSTPPTPVVTRPPTAAPTQAPPPPPPTARPSAVPTPPHIVAAAAPPPTARPYPSVVRVAISTRPPMNGKDVDPLSMAGALALLGLLLVPIARRIRRRRSHT